MSLSGRAFKLKQRKVFIQKDDLASIQNYAIKKHYYKCHSVMKNQRIIFLKYIFGRNNFGRNLQRDSRMLLSVFLLC